MLRPAGAVYFRVRAVAARDVLDRALVRLDEAFAVPVDLLFLPFVFVADRAGRDFFVVADALVDCLAVGALACWTEAVATVSAPAAVATPLRSDLEGRAAVVSDA